MDNGVRAHLPCERRRSERSICPPPPACPWLVLVGPNRWVATLCDVSVGGIAFSCCHIYPAGFHTTVELLNLETRTLMVKEACVVHCTPHDGESWMLGVRLVEPFSDAELNDLRSCTRRSEPWAKQCRRRDLSPALCQACS